MAVPNLRPPKRSFFLMRLFATSCPQTGAVRSRGNRQTNFRPRGAFAEAKLYEAEKREFRRLMETTEWPFGIDHTDWRGDPPELAAPCSTSNALKAEYHLGRGEPPASGLLGRSIR